MPRALRLILPGVATHVIQRGNNRSACFRQDSDYLVYLSCLRQLAKKHECAVHAYCLMTNHVHLLLSPATGGACIALMRELGQRYVQYFNRRHQRSGTLWEGRYRSCIVESARYVLGCYCYIESNPVRAEMVEHAAGYTWSSYAANGGMRADTLVAPHAEYLALALDDDTRAVAYRGLFERAQEPSLIGAIREATNGGYALASESFKATVLKPIGARTARGKPGPRVQLAEPEYNLQTQLGL